MRYYYTDPLKAAWMAREFKINLQIPHSYKEEDYGMLNVISLQVDASDDGTAHYVEAENNYGGQFAFGGEDPDDRYSGDFYIHPDCHEMLNPQIGDILQDKNVIEKVYKICVDFNEVWSRGAIFYPPFKIIQRDDKAFLCQKQKPRVRENNENNIRRNGKCRFLPRRH